MNVSSSSVSSIVILGSIRIIAAQFLLRCLVPKNHEQNSRSMLDNLPWMRGILIVVLFIIAWNLVREGLWVFRMSRKSATWPSVVGTIVSSEIVYCAGGGGDAVQTYEVKLAYEYSVGGTAYRCDRFGWRGDRSTSWKGHAKRIAASYPVGHAVTVYYDPADPAQAVLETRRLWGTLTGAAFALAILGAAMLALARCATPDL